MFQVYRVPLRETVRASRRFLARNSRATSTVSYYVGSTGLSLSARLQAHVRAGMGGNHIVQRHGVVGLAEVVSTHETREQAQRAEQDYAQALRDAGLGVWCNQKEAR